MGCLFRVRVLLCMCVCVFTCILQNNVCVCVCLHVHIYNIYNANTGQTFSNGIQNLNDLSKGLD